MRHLHFDCFSGISGDMTLAALFDLGVSVDEVRKGLDSLGLPITLEARKIRKGGFAATHVKVDAPDEEDHRYLPDIEKMIAGSALNDRQRDLARRIFRKLAEAEAKAHGMAIEKVHFHEVGALDSIADIIGAAIGFDLLKVDRVTAGPVAVGGGMVKCAHGLMPVPTPATAILLQGVPLRSTSLQAELTTPTGAAILATLVQEWIEQPAITIDAVGLGAGTRDFLEQPNVLRLFLGSSATNPAESDQVWLLETNLDDVPGEVVGYCFDQLLAAGALDVFTTAIQMKKNRPGILLSVLAPGDRLEDLETILMRETGTLGVRRSACSRTKLQRKAASVQTPWGPIQGKLAWRDGQTPIFSPEYDDCVRVARNHAVPLREVFRAAGEGKPTKS